MCTIQKITFSVERSDRLDQASSITVYNRKNKIWKNVFTVLKCNFPIYICPTMDRKKHCSDYFTSHIMRKISVELKVGNLDCIPVSRGGGAASACRVCTKPDGDG